MHVVTPRSLEDACAAMASAPLVPFAGGTDLMVHWPVRPASETRDRAYLDLSPLSDLRYIRLTDSELVLGALTTYWDVIQDARIHSEFPLLGKAARQVGAIQIQSRGTWAGNIANASPAADGVPVLMAYDAVVQLTSTQGTQDVPLAEFYTGYKVMRKTPDQLITAIRIPRRPYAFEHFEKVGARRAQTITKVGVAMTRSSQGWRIVASSVAPTVRRCGDLERRLDAGERFRSPADVLGALRPDIQPIDDIRSTAAYRAQVLANVIFGALSRP